MKLDALGVSSKDLGKTVAFYSLLGFKFPPIEPDIKHLEAITEAGGVRLMIDDHEVTKSIIGADPVPANHSTFAILCESPAEVNATIENVRAHGFTVVKEPWDAFWGQRYAIVADPDGYMVDLFVAL